jgi:hypothetical protein
MKPTILQVAVVLCFCSTTAIGNSGDNGKDENDDRGTSFDASIYDDDDYNYGNETTVIQWIADDPYFYYPQDEVLQQLNAEAEAMRAAEAARAKTISEKSTIDPIAVASVVCFSLGGLLASMFGVSVVLYYLKFNALMRQYATNGTVTDAKILASEPDMIGAIEKEKVEDKRGLVHIDGSNCSDEVSYAGTVNMTMDDDETISYRQMDTDEDGSDDTDNSEVSKEQLQSAAKLNLMQESNGKAAKTRLQRTSSLVRQTKILKQEELYTTQKFQIRRNNPAKESIRRYQKFLALVEYDNLATLDGSRVRKRLTILGGDVTIVESPGISSQKDFCIRLYVLPKRPMSGFPYSEVQRTRTCRRCIVFSLCILLGCVLVTYCVYTTFRSTSVFLFAGYISVLVVQIPLLGCFLGSSFDKVLSISYLEKGTHVSSEDVKEAACSYGQKLLQNEPSFLLTA